MKKYYKGETSKAVQNFQISGVFVSLKMIYSVAVVKKAAAEANNKIGRLSREKYLAISRAVDKILLGEFDTQFVTDQVQGGAGTSTNMNVNEVISSVAEEILKDKITVHPNDDVNMGQSTNDVIPTAIKLTLAKLMDELLIEMKKLKSAFHHKSKEFKNIIKVGRTHLQDAVPMTLGQSFGAYEAFVDRNIERLEENKKYVFTTNLGGTAIGSGINSSKTYIKEVNKNLARLTKYPFKSANNLFDATQNSDDLLHIASLLQTFTAGMSKISNDLRFLSAGPRAGLGELILPEVQKGSSIMPGKVNPVILELMNQICYQVFGNVETAFHVVLNSQFELNAMLPIYVKNMIEAFTVMKNGIKTFREKAILGIKPNHNKIKDLFDNSLCMATALNRYIGYDKTAEIVKKAIQNNTGLIEELKKESGLNKGMIIRILNPQRLTEPTDIFEK